MTNQEAIKYLQQLYPNGGHCWLDEQRIEAISMAVKALQEEPVELKEVDLEDAKKEELTQKYVNYTFKRHNIDPESKEGQLIYYAYMHGMNQCLTQLRIQKGE